MLNSGVGFVMGFFPASWGGEWGISQAEARAVLEGALAEMGLGLPARRELED
jgi:hypothetical protein